MDNTGYNLDTVVIAEAEKLNVTTDASLIRYITALAEQGIEEEVDNLWVMGKRPEGTYRERFTREVIIALKEHIQVVRQMEENARLAKALNAFNSPFKSGLIKKDGISKLMENKELMESIKNIKF
jgi:hypothetical protein